MTAPLTDYTTYNDIRASLGVSDEDIDDTTLALTLYADALQTELEEINIDLPATFVTVKAVGSPTDVQKRFLQASRLFATYAVARQLTGALSLFAAKQVSDSKATVERFADPYRDTIKSVNASFDKARTRLATALATMSSSTAVTTAQVYLSVASPSVDPVTGL